MTQLSSFQPLPLPPGPASAACTQLTPFPSCWAFPTMLTTRFYPSSYRVRSFPLPRKPASFRSPIGLPLHPSPFSAARRDPTLSGYWQLVCPLSKSVRGPIPTRHHATSETSVQSPLWKKNTSLAPALFLLFLLFSISVRVYPCLLPIFVCAHPASPPLSPCLPPRPLLLSANSWPVFVSLRSMARSFSLPFFRIFLSRFFCHFASVYPLPGWTMQRDPGAEKNEDREPEEQEMQKGERYGKERKGNGYTIRFN